MKHTKQLLWSILILGCFTTTTFSQNQQLFAKTDAYVQQMMYSLQIVGLNYLVMKDQKVVHKKAFGLAQAQLQVPMDLKHSFAVASISKLFSTIALHQLLAKQQRTVNETVADFLPHRKDLPEAWQKLTLSQLLSHTSGIPDQIDYEIYLAPPSDKYVIEALKDKPFSTPPGTSNKYNATGFLLIQLIIEQLAGKDFESYMKSQFFEPLQLTSADYGGFKKVLPNRVTCYHNINNQLQMFPLNYAAPMYAGAGLNITIEDIATWFTAVQQEQFLNKKQLQKIWTPVKLQNGKDGTFGLGWEARRLPNHYRMTGHGGAGIHSFRYYWNEKTSEKLTIIILTNGALDWKIRPHQLNLQIASMLLGEE